MPWCPNCKAEYQEGYTICSDCKIELVDDIKEAEILIPFFQAEDKKIAEKLVKFFQYSDLNASFGYDEENELYVVSIPPKKQMQAKKLYQAFYYVERERLANGDSDLVNSETADDNSEDNTTSEEQIEDGDVNPSFESEASSEEDTDYGTDTPSDEVTAFDEEEHQSGVYIMKADQYKDLAGTVWIFLFFGVVGLMIVILNAVGILSFLNGWIPISVMGTLFLFFIYVAISTNQKAKKIQAEIDAENELTAKINEWLNANITKEFLSSIYNDTFSDEVNYIKSVDTIKEMLLKEFGSQNLAYLDRLIEEHYSNNIDSEIE